MRIKDKSIMPSYFKKLDLSGEPIQVSVRIPASVKQDFEAAVEAARKIGFDMTLVDVVQSAMKDACEEVRKLRERTSSAVPKLDGPDTT